jgi:hypothetical protein
MTSDHRGFLYIILICLYEVHASEVSKRNSNQKGFGGMTMDYGMFDAPAPSFHLG